MAEFIMKDLVAQANRENEFEIASAATSTEEIGNPVYPPVVRLLNRNGIDCSQKRARQITPADYNYYDLLIIMDHYNQRTLRYVIKDDPQNKIHRLLDYTSQPADIADPWYTHNFELTWLEISTGCKALLKKFK